MPIIELDNPAYNLSDPKSSPAGFFCPANVWISDDRKEVIVTGGNITFHEGREFSTGYISQKSDLDCALEAFERGFQGYYKKNK
ncbi:MAG: hypothetical protein WC901_05125 [Candidatus Margulisiibacteriota bacterium]